MKNNLLKKENLYFFILIIIIFLLDRYTKNLIITNYNENNFFINEYLNFDLIWNTGIGFGLLGATSPIIYNLITAFIGGVIIFLFFSSINLRKTDKLIFCIIIGGAIGNLYDRLKFKAVPDFIDIHFNGFHWFTFNVADIFITIGILAFILRNFFVKN